MCDKIPGSCCSGEDVRREVKQLEVSGSQRVGKHSAVATEVVTQLSVVRVAFFSFFLVMLSFGGKGVWRSSVG